MLALSTFELYNRCPKEVEREGREFCWRGELPFLYFILIWL